MNDPASIRTPTDLYVITTAKVRDSLSWELGAAKLGLGANQEYSFGSIKVTVDSWNNIQDYLDVENAFFIFDEQRAVGGGAWANSFIKIAKKNKFIMLSATPGDTWLDYIPIFVANGFYKNRTQFRQEHVVYKSYLKFPKVDRYVGVGKLVRLRNSLLVTMPMERHTTRHVKHLEVPYDEELFRKVVKERWHVYEDRPLRDVAELFSAMRKVVNSDSSRLRVIQDLLNTHPRLIVFYNFDYELEILRTLVPEGQLASSESIRDLKEKLDTRTKYVERQKYQEVVGSGITRSNAQDDTASFAVAEWNGHKHEPIPKTDRWVYLVQYTAGAEGWDCIETNAMVFYSLTYSYRAFYQSFGRTDRLNTPYRDLFYYVLKSTAPIDRGIWEALSHKKNFNESSFRM